MAFDLKKLVRPNILNLAPYSCARNEFSGEARAWLDANESPYNAPYDRYPDPLQLAVKQKLSEVKGVPAENIFLGVGSDECIDMTYRVFCRPGIDNVVAISPSYGMYGVCADINDVEYREVLLEEGTFALDVDALLAAADANTKAIWLCSPNNPTGNAFPVDQIEQVCRKFDGIVVVDEAYGDFSSQPSMTSRLGELPNLIVMQTMSKAWGSAAVRLGIGVASTEIISIFNNVKYPYNISLLTQRYALDMLARKDEVAQWVATLLGEREWLVEQLQSLEQVEHVFPSDANFVLARVTDATAIYKYLLDKGVVVRNRTTMPGCKNCLRLTVGTREENELVIEAIASYGK